MNAVLTWECWVSQAIKMQPSQQSWIFLIKKTELNKNGFKRKKQTLFISKF